MFCHYPLLCAEEVRLQKASCSDEVLMELKICYLAVKARTSQADGKLQFYDVKGGVKWNEKN